MKRMTLGEAETKRQKAVEFLRRIGNDEAADDFESMSAEEYAEHKGAQIVENPSRRYCRMARRTKTKEELQAQLDEANEYIEELEGKLDDISGIIGEEEEEEGEESEEEDEDED